MYVCTCMCAFMCIQMHMCMCVCVYTYTPDCIIKECLPIGCGWKVLKTLRLEYTGLKASTSCKERKKMYLQSVVIHSFHSYFLNVLDTKCMHSNFLILGGDTSAYDF